MEEGKFKVTVSFGMNTKHIEIVEEHLRKYNPVDHVGEDIWITIGRALAWDATKIRDKYIYYLTKMKHHMIQSECDLESKAFERGQEIKSLIADGKDKDGLIERLRRSLDQEMSANRELRDRFMI